MKGSRYKQTKARKGEREICYTPARLGLRGRGLKRHLDDGGDEMESFLDLLDIRGMRCFHGKKAKRQERRAV